MRGVVGAIGISVYFFSSFFLFLKYADETVAYVMQLKKKSIQPG